MSESRDESYMLQSQAWDNILRAPGEPEPVATLRLNAAHNLLQSIVTNRQLVASQRGSYLHSRLTLASWKVLSGVVHGQPISRAATDHQREQMATLLYDITEGTYDLDDVGPHISGIATDAIVFGVVARLRKEGVYAYPSHPDTQHDDFYDEESGLTVHHMHIATPDGVAPTYLYRSGPAENRPEDIVFTLQPATMLLSASTRVSTVNAVARRAGPLGKGVKALTNLAARCLGEEEPGEGHPYDGSTPAGITRAQDVWLGLAGQNLVNSVREFCRQRDAYYGIPEG